MQAPTLDSEQDTPDSGTCRNRLSFYAFLGAVLGQPLDSTAVGQLFQADYVKSFRDAFPDSRDNPAFDSWISFIEQQIDQDVDALQQMLAVEFTRLFRGLHADSGPRPPYESVYLSGLGGHHEACANILRSVAVFYQKVELAPQVRERIDFIGLEMDLMRCLLEEELKGREAGNMDGVLHWLNLEREFLREHLLRWLSLFAEEVAVHARLDFYKSILAISAQYLEDDAQYLDEEIKRLS